MQASHRDLPDDLRDRCQPWLMRAALVTFAQKKGLYATQLLLTCLVLGIVPGNGVKLALFVFIWAMTFRDVQRVDLALFSGICLFFTCMNIGALRNGVFFFHRPDILGMPVYEFFMWGFYVLHLLRVIDAPAPRRRLGLSILLATAFALPFALIAGSDLLLLATAMVLATALLVFHDRWDFVYVGYMILVGALIEYTGVWSGQWSYPGGPPGGVPLWFLTLWGGVGLFTRRLLLPLLPPRKYAAT